eukprot:8147505-Pyramimonas_sp.AAC.1
MRIAREWGYPAVVVELEVLMFAASRFIKDKAVLSKPIGVSRSIVAGSPRGVSLARVFRHPVLQRAHTLSPRAWLWRLVDDTVARTDGTHNEAPEKLIEVALALAQGIRQQRLTISDKTVLIGTDRQMVKDTARILGGVADQSTQRTTPRTSGSTQQQGSA